MSSGCSAASRACRPPTTTPSSSSHREGPPRSWIARLRSWPVPIVTPPAPSDSATAPDPSASMSAQQQPADEGRGHAYDLFEDGSRIGRLAWRQRPRTALGWYLEQGAVPPRRLFVDAAID